MTATSGSYQSIFAGGVLKVWRVSFKSIDFIELISVCLQILNTTFLQLDNNSKASMIIISLRIVCLGKNSMKNKIISNSVITQLRF